MPPKPLHPCAAPGCPTLVRDGSYCPTHKRERVQQYDQARGSASRRGYGTRWRRLRTMFLAAHPLCGDPYRRHPDQAVMANEVDHILARAQGGTDEWGNLQGLCSSCHSHKTALEDGRWGGDASTGVPR